MALNCFQLSLKSSVEAETKYVLALLSILSDQYGRIFDFDPRKIECLCDLGPRTVATSIQELTRLNLINIPERDFVQLILPQFAKSGDKK